MHNISILLVMQYFNFVMHNRIPLCCSHKLYHISENNENKSHVLSMNGENLSWILIMSCKLDLYNTQYINAPDIF